MSLFKKVNFYIFFGCIIFFWMLFFDAANWRSCFYLRGKIQRLKQEKAFYLEKIQEIKHHEKILQDDCALEKFAREKYFMKKPGEEIYLMEEE